jgi:hypothetical protein
MGVEYAVGGVMAVLAAYIIFRWLRSRSSAAVDLSPFEVARATTYAEANQNAVARGLPLLRIHPRVRSTNGFLAPAEYRNGPEKYHNG